MPHVVLLGDSIFDNGRYVPGQPDVVEQLRRELPTGWQATLLAVDGNVTIDVSRQLERLPSSATHLVVSVGGNDALRESGVLHEPATSVATAIGRLSEVRDGFAAAYRDMLAAVLRLQLPTAVCTVYDAIPGLERAAVTALGAFNETILRQAFAAALPVVDLRLVCDQAADYSPLSPIEPSHLGGAKIARTIATMLREHDFARRRTVVYG